MKSAGKILSFDLTYKEDLDKLCRSLSEEPQEVPISFSKDLSSTFNSIPPVLFVANARELAFYEDAHLVENTSYAIGQLAVAEWKLKAHSKETRELRHKLEAKTATEEDFDRLLHEIWSSELSANK